MNQKIINGGHTSNKGITLIALVITIIVLLILAGVTINMVLGDDGIIYQAEGAKDATVGSTLKEEYEIIYGEEAIKNKGNTEGIVERDVLKRAISKLPEEEQKKFQISGDNVIYTGENEEVAIFTASKKGYVIYNDVFAGLNTVSEVTTTLGQGYEVKDKDGNGLSRDNLATGDLLYKDSEKIAEIAVIGDIDRNGMINGDDAFAITKFLNGSKEIQGIELLAADVNGNKLIEEEDAKIIETATLRNENISFSTVYTEIKKQDLFAQLREQLKTVVCIDYDNEYLDYYHVVAGIEVGTRIEELNLPDNMWIENDTGDKLTTGVIKSGYFIYAKSSKGLVDDYGEIVIYGDINRDGTINEDDLTMLQGAFNVNGEFDGNTLNNAVEFFATDINGDKLITSDDITALQNYIAGTYTINQQRLPINKTLEELFPME